MKDHELFELVRRAVAEKQSVPHPADSRSFAERYTAQQLHRKKLSSHPSHQKMDFLMKKFSQLDTYIDLPQLLATIQLMQLRQTPTPPPLPLPPPIPIPQVHHKSVDYRGLRFVVDNERLQGVKQEAGGEGWRSELVKNNSCCNMEIAMGRVGEGVGNEAVFKLLQRFQENEQQFMQDEQQTHIQETALNNEHKKMVTDFLHKVSSYLQIVLETQHRSKWNRPKHTTLRKTLPDFIALNKHNFTQHTPSRHNPTEHTSSKLLSHPPEVEMSNTRYIESLKQQTKKIRQKKNLVKRPKMNHSSSRFLTQNMSRTHEGFSLQTEGESTQEQLRENFTFRRRSVKQRIMRRLDHFIGQVDEESHCSRKENKYYHEEINKLEHQFKRIYGRYKRQTLAGDKDIENLQKMAQEFGRTPMRQLSRRGTVGDAHPTSSTLQDII